MRNQKNSKLEIRNSKQIQMIKKQKFQTILFLIAFVGFDCPGLFRISLFGFWIFTR